MRPVIAFALCLVVAGCAPGPTAPASVKGPAVHAEDVQGPFRLAFDLSSDTWKVGDPIDGLATFSLAQGDPVDLGGSGGGLLGFDFVEVNGSRHIEAISTADCRPYRLAAGAPMTSLIKKSGGFSVDQPDVDFYRAFLADPLIRLPAGDWTITANANFVEGQGCTGQSHTLRATVQVHITP